MQVAARVVLVWILDGYDASYHNINDVVSTTT